MPIPLDQITRKKLVLVKQIYQRAVIDSSGLLSATNRMVSVIEFDLAMETILKAIVLALNPSKTPPTGFPELIKEVNLLLKSANLPDEAHVRHVRHIRNNAQHQAIYPNETDVSDCRTHTRDFLNAIIQQVWSVNFENISLADLIEDPDIKQLMLDAYQQYEEQNYSGAVDLASEAMDRTTDHIEKAVVGELPHRIEGIATTDHLAEVETAMEKEDGMYRLSRHTDTERVLLTTFRRMREILMYLALELNLSQLVRYRQIIGTTFFTRDNKHHRVSGKRPNIDQADAEFALSYCTDAIVRIEAHVGSLQKPFGIDW